MADESISDQASDSPLTRAEGNLTESQIQLINEGLARIGDFGQIKLIKEKGKLRFLVCEESYDFLRLHPGDIEDNCK